MDRRITRSLASRVKNPEEQNVKPESASAFVAVRAGSKKKKIPTVSKYHYEYDMWGRRKRVPNRDHSEQAEVENMMVITSPEQKQIICGQGDDYTSKQRTKTSTTSSPRKRKASQSAANNIQVKMEGVVGSGRQSSSNAHQRNSCSHPQAQAKVNSNISDGQVVVKKEKIGNNHCAKQQQYEQQQLVPKSSSRSSNNHRNQLVHQHHHVLNEATNISKQPASNKMIPVTITITSDSSEISESKQRQLAMVQRQQSNIHQNLAINNNTMLSHLDLPSSSNRVMMNTEVGTTGIATGSSPSVSSFDDEDIPEASVDFPKGILSTIKCNGCNKDFFTLDHVPKSDYYFHCFQCPEYCNKSKLHLFHQQYISYKISSLIHRRNKSMLRLLLLLHRQ